jgi:hypothetical protein
LSWRPPHSPQNFAPLGNLVPQLIQNGPDCFEVFPALVVCERVASVGATWFSCVGLLDWLFDEVPRLIRRNTAARNSPAKIPVRALNVVTSVVSVVVVMLVNVDIAVIASGVSVEVEKLVSVKAEYIVAVVVAV